MIDRTTVDRIFETAHIVEVVEEFVSLKKRGSNYTGCCPFHNERTPSFSVSPSKNIYKCFGCGKAGNAVNFIMEHEHLGYVDALRYLAKKYNIEIVEKEQTAEEKLQTDKRESLMVVSAYASRVFQDNLFNTREGMAIGLSYFKERGFREEIIKEFELGYCLEARDAFTKKSLKDGYKEEFLIDTGLSIKSERGTFDRFSGRVMFPIHSLAGKVTAFGGRILKSDKNTAKYLNSPESDIYHKSKVLYGIFQAKKTIVQNDKCYLVEGYTDVLSMYQAGVQNVVASSGTSLTVEQIQLIKRFTPNITVLYDGDTAGIKASLRGIDLILQEDMNVKVLLLPDGEDPDSFSRKHGTSELEEYIRANETDFITFKARLLLDDAKDDPVKRSQMITDVVRSVSLIPKPITRAVYIKECSKMFEVDERMLTDTVDNMRREKPDKRRTSTVEKSANSEQLPTEKIPIELGQIPPTIEETRAVTETEFAEKEIIRLLISYGNETLIDENPETGEDAVTVAEYLIREIRADDLDFRKPIFRKIFDEYDSLFSDGVIVDDKHFVRHPDPEISRLTAELIEPKYVLSGIHAKSGVAVKTEENSLRAVVTISLMAYKYKRVMVLLKDIAGDIRQAEVDGEKERMESLYAQYMSLTRVKKELGLILGRRIFY